MKWNKSKFHGIFFASSFFFSIYLSLYFFFSFSGVGVVDVQSLCGYCHWRYKAITSVRTNFLAEKKASNRFSRWILIWIMQKQILCFSIALFLSKLSNSLKSRLWFHNATWMKEFEGREKQTKTHTHTYVYNKQFLWRNGDC